MVKLIERAECIKIYPIFPLRKYNKLIDEEEYFYPECFSFFELTLKAKSFKHRAKLVAKALRKLFEKLEIDSLIFLGDEAITWRFREHIDFVKPVKKAFKYLKALKIKKKFNGGLELSLAEAFCFWKHLAWLSRTNGILQYVHFIDKEQHLILSICQYGNVHVSVRNKETDELFRNLLEQSKLNIRPCSPNQI